MVLTFINDKNYQYESSPIHGLRLKGILSGEATLHISFLPLFSQCGLTLKERICLNSIFWKNFLIQENK